MPSLPLYRSTMRHHATCLPLVCENGHAVHLWKIVMPCPPYALYRSTMRHHATCMPPVCENGHAMVTIYERPFDMVVGAMIGQKMETPTCASLDPVFQPRKIAVLGLTPDICKADVISYFGNFGLVEEAVLKPCHKHTHMSFAFVKFSSQAAVETVLSMAPHMIKMHDVRVDRARRHVHANARAATPVPACPFPGMDPMGKFLLADLENVGTAEVEAPEFADLRALWQ